MKFKRFFTKDNQEDIFAKNFKKSVIEIKNLKGASLFTTLEVEIPINWSQSSVDILVKRYFRDDGVPVFLKKIPEDRIPQWLWRREPDYEKLSNLPKEERYVGEVSAKQVFDRIVGAWTYWGYKLNYFENEASAKIFYDEIYYILCHQMAAPNSPQWYNTGINWAYGITGKPQGHFYYDEQEGGIVKSESAYARPQPHSNFIQNLEDNLVNKNGLLDLFLKEARLLKYGSVTGTNFSKIRAKGEKLVNGGVSSGVVSFLKSGDSSASSIKPSGNNRAISKMAILDVDHPDIQDFINWKVKEEQKVVSLATGSVISHRILQMVLNSCNTTSYKEEERFDIFINKELKKSLSIAKSFMVPDKFIHKAILLAKQGIFNLDFATFTIAWGSESYQSVSGQNTDVSVSVTNDFLNKVLEDEDWRLINRFDGTLAKTLKAKTLWDFITYSAWSCSYPGLYYSDTLNDWHTCPKSGKINGTNPGSEYLFLDDTSCSTASINLMHFRHDDGSFNTEAFKYVTIILTFMLEISVGMAQFPSERIAYLSYKFRPIGLGYTNLGTYLMSIGLPYDSYEARNMAASITALMTGTAYYASSIIAKKTGAFLDYKINEKDMLRVISNHKKAVYGEADGYEGISIKPVLLQGKFVKDVKLLSEAKNAWDLALSNGEKYGFRNAQVTSISLTGTIGDLMDCSTRGIDPDFSLVKYHNINGEGYTKIVNNSVKIALISLGYSTDQINEAISHIIGHKTIKGAKGINHDTLKEKGFSDIEIEKIENTLPNIFNIEFAFSPHILGESFCVDQLGISKDNFKDPNFSLLQAIGFTKKEVQEANCYVTGYLSLENCAIIKTEHFPVFDCGEICGSLGTRQLSYESHINMLTSIQPFITGGIFKVINMPSNSTIEDCSNAYMLAWKKGAKTTSLYIQGSKLSQPIQNSLLDDESIINNDIINTIFDLNI